MGLRSCFLVVCILGFVLRSYFRIVDGVVRVMCSCFWVRSWFWRSCFWSGVRVLAVISVVVFSNGV